MTTSKKEKWAIAIGITLPLLLVLGLVLFLYIPPLLANPEYTFLYSANNTEGTRGNVTHAVNADGVLEARFDPSPYRQDETPDPDELYLIDPKNDSYTSISLEEAQQLTLSRTSKSPDGYAVECGNRVSGGFFFVLGGGTYTDCRKLVVTKGAISKEVPTPSVDSYRGASGFVGWVLEK